MTLRSRFVTHTLCVRYFPNCLLRKFGTDQGKLSDDQNNDGGTIVSDISSAIKALSSNRTKRISRGKTLYLIDALAAKQFASFITADRKTNPSHVVEMNAGIGFLTKELLDAGIPSIYVFEGIANFIPNLRMLARQYQDRVHIRTADFYSLLHASYIDYKENTNRMGCYLRDPSKNEWMEEPFINIIGSLASFDIIPRLLKTIIFNNGFNLYGRMILHLAVPPGLWGMLNCTNTNYYLYRPHIVLFQTLFRCRHLGSLPRSAFYPSYRKSKVVSRITCVREINKDNDRLMYVVEIEANPDLFTDDFTQNDMIPFSYFVNYHLKSRRNKVIPTLEHWIPGCGPSLIAEGYNIFTEFGELTPSEILSLYKKFKSWPDYKKSTFISCMDTFMMRMDENIVFDTDSDEDDSIFKSSMDQDLLKE